ncbi:biogenesis of lysosome-related organelles complex 1 subunit 4 [Patella vulgata]|uniref:biogenesis of lysosome-related organelles complex 1 subunit 4 n=1 Tax=Patella vulgata TaxID=6465 RepID=UPI0024A850FF|nr:biogenesis of lysosome-related organelles complex 1 subunit 4 [Patella vulgata]
MIKMEEKAEENQENVAGNGDEVERTVEQLLAEVAIDYRTYLNFDISKEQGKYYESIEGMLTKLDEFCGLVDLIRSDTNLCLNTTLPRIHEKSSEIRNIFEKIDNLEKFVGIVKQNVNMMEEKVNDAEKEVGGSFGSGIMKKLSSIVGSKKNVEKKKYVYEEPVIFNTDDYFPQHLDSDQSKNTVDPPVVSSTASSLDKT